MPRAIWSGTISFGLVSAPVKMYAAIDEHDLELHLVHEKDGSRIGYEKVCKKEGSPVPADEIVKAYEVEEGEVVYLEDEDFEAAHEEGYRVIEVLDFVRQEEIDPIVFQRTYYLGPDKGGDKVYALLRRAMEEAELVAVARYVFHERQQLGCLRVREGVITLENMYFADEIRPVKGIAPKGQRVDKRELDMAKSLIDRFTSEFDHTKYKDEYRRRLLEIVKRKRRGEEIHVASREKEAEPPDLLEALRASVEASKKRTNGRRSRSRKTSRRTARARK